ncbi:Abscisic acid 8'-hydroxylase 1 [Rhynchospora pubera]|uniref:Abscisic acid 8'-hydroxylase 1 n=1 Tax=Rhynchospora pubera TaxID=906938 RepID=A0AAV8HF67_9POAL|nr:Abscisic acid 8'-hydroxylase 1 [Rhynchospora pubera]
MDSKEENRGTLTTEQIADNVIGVLFAAQDTTASALTWILKYLHDYPNVLDIVKVFSATAMFNDWYLIPKGWKVMPLFRNIHHNAEFFQDPDKFNPSRFEVAPRPNTFLPFGNGVHACPGNELAKIEILVLIYHLVTNYRWDVIDSSDEVEYSPFAVPKGGLPAKIWRL